MSCNLDFDKMLAQLSIEEKVAQKKLNIPME